MAASGNSLFNDWRIANNCLVKIATVDSETPRRATIWCEKLIVLTSSSGRLGVLPNVPAGISEASYAGKFCAIAAADSIARNFGVTPGRVVAAIASAVILLLTGPAAR